jgi:PAS domain S-box-containing protein
LEIDLAMRLADLSDAPILLVEDSGRAFDANRAAREMLGLETDEARHRSLQDITAEPDAEVRAMLRRWSTSSDCRATRLRMVADDGTEIPCIVKGRAVRPGSANESAIIGLVCDPLHDAGVQARGRSGNLAPSMVEGSLIAMLGHELRNPIGAIRVAALALPEAGTTAPRLLRILATQSEHLSRIVDHVLDLARADSGTLVNESQLLHLDQLVADCVETIASVADDGCGEIDLRTARVDVEADPCRVRQIVDALLDNANRHTPSRARIAVELDAAGDQAIVRVADDGDGVDPAVSATLFSPFVQAGQDLARDAGGLGLGLAVAKKLAQLNGGDVDLVDGGPLRGATFELRLPLREPSRQSPPSDRRGARTATDESLDILVVDDDDDGRFALTALLESWGHRLTSCGDGGAALQAMQNAPPQIALVDIGLPVIDGYELAARFRDHEKDRHTVLVALTGYGTPEDRERALDAGFDHHIVKPVAESELRELLRPRSRRRSE